MSVDVRAPAYRLLADDLRAQICSGHLVPGDRLPTEPQLCQRSGVSRSTVREALRLLASQHLIVTTRGVAGGSFVAHPSPDQLSDTLRTGVRLLHATSVFTLGELLEVRECVEVPAAGLAAQRRRPDQIEALRESLFDPATRELDDMVATHPLFHQRLAATCGNPLLELLIRPLFEVANAPEILAAFDREAWRGVANEHQAIFDAVVAGDSVAAEAATLAHIVSLRAVCARVLPPSVFPPAAVSGVAAA